jgi:NADH-quinone oxidoreductase subunit N
MADMLESILASTKLFYPELTLTAAFCAVIVVDLFARGNRTASAVTAMAGTILAAWFVVDGAAAGSGAAYSSMVAVDGFARFFKLVILASALIVQVFSLQSRELRASNMGPGEYFTLLTAMTLGMTLMAGANHLIMMYLALELTSISSYLLAGYTRDADDSAEAALKYVIYGSVASGMMLYGMSVLFGLTGSFYLQGINLALSAGGVSLPALVVAGVLITVGFGYKISAVPFHFWTPDVYEGAPVTITALLSVASKAAGFAMMIRFFAVTFVDLVMGGGPESGWGILNGFEWTYLIGVLAVLTMTVGNLVAIWQNNLKRLLAYSSIAHAGYMLLGVAALSNEGFSSVMIYFVIYLFMNLGAFYIVMLVADKTGTEDISGYEGLGHRAPFIGVAMTIFLLSLTGIPPTAGFIGKLYVFSALIDARLIWLVVIGALNSVVSLYYYVRVLRGMFLKEPAAGAAPLKFSPAEIAVTLVLLIPTLALGLYFGPLVEYAQASVSILGLP